MSKAKRPTKHIIGHIGDGFYGSNDPTNSVKALKELSYRRETALQGGLVMTKSRRLELEDNIYGHYRYSTTATYLASKAIEFCEKNVKGLLRRSRPFKVMEIGINRKTVCDFLLVIRNRHPISYRFGVSQLIVHFAFLSHPLGRLVTMYNVHLVLSSLESA